jgi:hypothetical protein
VELWKQSDGLRWAAWTAFGFGISLSLCANVGSAPRLTVFSIVVAACPPLALLLAVELLNRALKGHRRNSEQPDAGPQEREPAGRPRPAACSADPLPEPAAPCEKSAEELMWALRRGASGGRRRSVRTEEAWRRSELRSCNLLVKSPHPPVSDGVG